MDGEGIELSLLATFSAFLCGIAFYQDNLIAAAAFAALTCTTTANPARIDPWGGLATKSALAAFVA